MFRNLSLVTINYNFLITVHHYYNLDHKIPTRPREQLQRPTRKCPAATVSVNREKYKYILSTPPVSVTCARVFLNSNDQSTRYNRSASTTPRGPKPLLIVHIPSKHGVGTTLSRSCRALASMHAALPPLAGASRGKRRRGFF